MIDRRGPGPQAHRFFRSYRRRRALKAIWTQRTASIVVAGLICVGIALNAPWLTGLIAGSPEERTQARSELQSILEDPVVRPSPAPPVEQGHALPSAARAGDGSVDAPWLNAPGADVIASGPTATQTVSGRRVRVVDGDTLRLPDGERVRLLNIDTPEMPPRSQCENERRLALEAKARLQALVREGELIFQPGPRDRDRYGRQLRRVEINGRDLGDQLIVEGLAQPWAGAKANWC